MRTYRQLFAVDEFRALFAGQLVIGASMTIQALAVSVLVYDRTASPLLAAAGFLAGSLPQAVGAIALSGLSDRLAPRVALVGTDALRALASLAIVSGMLPVGGILATLMASGVVLRALAGIRLALVARLLPKDGYLLGRSVIGMAGDVMQIAGYAAGGGVIALFGSRAALWSAVALALAACLTDGCGLRERVALGNRRSVSDTWRGTLRLLRGRTTGRLLVGQCVPNGLIVGAEALFVPYAGSRSAVLLTTTGAGLLIGTMAVGRWLPVRWRARAGLPLYLLLALPYLAFAAEPTLWSAVGLVAVASIGYAGTLCLQQQFVAVVPEDVIGQALALASAGMLTAQGLAAYLAGAIAQVTRPGIAMAVMAAFSLLATLALLARGTEREPEPAPPATALIVSSGPETSHPRRLGRQL
jgi:MFS family permease